LYIAEFESLEARIGPLEKDPKDKDDAVDLFGFSILISQLLLFRCPRQCTLFCASLAHLPKDINSKSCREVHALVFFQRLDGFECIIG